MKIFVIFSPNFIPQTLQKLLHNLVYTFNTQLLHRPAARPPRLASGECRCSRVLLHHPNTATVQADPPLLRPQDPAPDLPSLRQGADAAGVLPRARDHHLRQPCLLCGENSS